MYLGDRVLLLGGTPAEIVREYRVDIPRNQRREGEAFLRKIEEVKAGLHEAIAVTANNANDG